MKQERELRSCLDKISKHKIKIIRGPLFDWTQPGNSFPIHSALPTACDAIGAIMVCHGWTFDVEYGFKPGWLSKIYDLLDVDLIWLHKFCLGWDQNFQVQIEVTVKKKSYFVEDEVSKMGIILAKEYCDL